MDFNDTPEEAAYRAQVRTWLEANAPKRAVPQESERVSEPALRQSNTFCPSSR